jgi:hypothetical protein
MPIAVSLQPSKGYPKFTDQISELLSSHRHMFLSTKDRDEVEMDFPYNLLGGGEHGAAVTREDVVLLRSAGHQ